MQAVHGRGQPRGPIAVQPVGHQEGDGTLGQDALGPAAVEQRDGLSDARATRPVRDSGRHHLERGLGVAVAQLPRDVGKPGAEQKHVHARPCVGNGVQEVQEKLGVTGHGARDVAQNHQRRGLRGAAAAGQREDIAAGAEAAAEGGGEVDGRPGRVGPGAAGRAGVERKGKAADLRFGAGDLGGGHLLEVHPLKLLAVADGEGGVPLRGAVLGRLLGAGGLYGFRQAPGAGARRLGLGRPLVEESHEVGHVGAGRVPPEQRESLVEQVLVLVAVDEEGAQSGLDLDAILQADDLQGLRSGDDRVGPHRKPGTPKEGREVQEVGGKMESQNRVTLP